MDEYEVQLITKAKDNPHAFGELYDKYYQRIFNYILRSTYNLESAQDITSETFFKALKSISKFKFTDKGTFQAWLYKIATNEINLYFRQNNRYKFFPTEDIDQYYSEEIPDEEISSALHDMDLQQDVKELQGEISKLDEKYRNILFLRFFEGKKFSEIEEITGIKEATLKSHMSRALDKLRDSLKEKGIDETKIMLLILLSMIIYFSINAT